MYVPQLMSHHESHGLQSSIDSLIDRCRESIFRIESEGSKTASLAFLSHFGDSIDSNILGDKVFYVADRVDHNSDGIPYRVHIIENSLVTLHQLSTQSIIPTVSDLRNKLVEGFLISGVAGVRINTANGIRIPIIQRDQGALADGGKFTLPAGRADKSIGNTVYEELIEELLIFGRKNNKLYLVIPFIDNPGISRKKVLQIVTMARLNYISTLFQQEEGIPILNIAELLSAEPIFINLNTPHQGNTIQSVFYNPDGSIAQETSEDGFYPFYDGDVNTYEMIRFFDLDLSMFDSLDIKDGDGHSRNIALVSRDDIEKKYSSSDFVNSLKHALRVGIFDTSK